MFQKLSSTTLVFLKPKYIMSDSMRNSEVFKICRTRSKQKHFSKSHWLHDFSVIIEEIKNYIIISHYKCDAQVS